MLLVYDECKKTIHNKFIEVLNCLNLGKDFEYLELIKKQSFYTQERKNEIINKYKLQNANYKLTII